MAHSVEKHVANERYPSNELMEAGIDWVTCITGGQHSTAVIRARVASWIAERSREYGEPRPWQMWGYTGQTIDGITCGDGPGGFLTRLSGDMAKLHGPVALTFADHVSRLDIQVTLRDTKSHLDWADYVTSMISFDKRVQTGLTKTSTIKSTPNGHTSYIGSRASNRYMRCYDKTAESRGVYPDGCWRWEVEYKKARALNVGGRLCTAGFRTRTYLSIVEQAFADYNVGVPCSSVPQGWRDSGVRHETNDEKRLTWLARSIRPMMDKLQEVYGQQLLRNVLGLNDDESDVSEFGVDPATDDNPGSRQHSIEEWRWGAEDEL